MSRTAGPGRKSRARSTDPRVHVGDALAAAFAGVGSAGGHREMAGGEVPLGIFADHTTDDEGFPAVVERVVTRRLVTAFGLDDAADEG